MEWYNCRLEVSIDNNFVTIRIILRTMLTPPTWAKFPIGNLSIIQSVKYLFPIDLELYKFGEIFLQCLDSLRPVKQYPGESNEITQETIFGNVACQIHIIWSSILQSFF